MEQRDTLAIGLPVGSNCLAPLSEFVVTAKVFLMPGLRTVYFYHRAGCDPLIYRVDDVAKRYFVQRAQPNEVEVVLDRQLFEQGYEIVWETQQ